MPRIPSVKKAPAKPRGKKKPSPDELPLMDESPASAVAEPDAREPISAPESATEPRLDRPFTPAEPMFEEAPAEEASAPEPPVMEPPAPKPGDRNEQPLSP